MRFCGMAIAAALVALPIAANAQTPAPQPSSSLEGADLAPGGAATEQPPRVTILEENDSLYFNSDKHYTQGLRISNLFGGTPAPGGWWDGIYNIIGFAGPIFETGGGANTIRRTSVFAGQSIFTPKNLMLKPPDPKDRPYAGWAYGGISLMQETNKHMLENFELDLGIVGPGSLAEQAQNDFHQFIGAQNAEGWSDQLQHEFGGMLSYERYWKLSLLGDNSFGVDVIPEVGATVGNVMTYGDVGGNAADRQRARGRLRAGAGAPVAVRHRLFRLTGSITARLVFLRRDAGPGGRAQHLPRRQHVPPKPQRAEKDLGRRRAGGVLVPVERIVADRFHGRDPQRGIPRPEDARHDRDGGTQLQLVVPVCGSSARSY